ncbi:MAG: EAL domain-containing protein [Gammaproteobacteria bacterium]|nr:EAL domain-containing protein [Gammaproteobacteria bacterium]
MDHSSTLTGLHQALNGERTPGGLDVIYTKLAVDLQNLAEPTAEQTIQSSLEVLRDSVGCDAVCIALLDEHGATLEKVFAARGPFSPCNPEVLQGRPLAEFPWLRREFAHLRLCGVMDTSTPAPGQEVDATRLENLRIAAIQALGFEIGARPAGFIALCFGMPQPIWSADHQLLLKLLGSSFASGLARLRDEHHLALMAEREEIMIRAANDGSWDFDALNNIMNFSPRWKAIMGYSDEELARSPPDWRRLVHPDDLARVQAKLRDHLAGKTEIFESVHRMCRRDGEWRWVQCRAKGLMDERGRLRRLIGVETDITEQKVYEEALFREKESAQITLQSIGDGVITTDAECNVEYCNPVSEELTGWRVDDATGRPIDEIFRGFHEETCEPLENPLAVAIRRNRSIKSVRPTLLIRRDGNEIYIESTASPIRDDKGEVTGGVLVFHDVSEARELNRRLSYHASHDILTGLVNRREFESRLERALKSARARETSYVLCYLDLDQFKIVNDSCGHSAGDALLGQMGALLKGKIRWRDTLARLGGDEFGLLLESCSLDEAMRTAESLREAIREHKFTWDDRTFSLGVSIGVVPINAEAEDVASLLSAADSACQAAKEAGRNRIYSYQDNDIDLLRRRREMQWAARINNALEENRFELFRQTIQPLQVHEDGAHYELLLRMRDENGKLVSPDLFISAAERYGITPNIDRWVVSQAFRWLVSDVDERERLVLCSINLSGQSLTDDDFLPYVVEQFQTSGLDATKICFEITETAAIASYAQASRFINALKELGCKFALDDFGTGLSSFGYLKHFPVDYLKIDGSFVKEILHDPIDREMVRSINEIGHLTGKQTIGEFAENNEIITMLKGMGVDYAQGFGVAEPKRVLMAAVNA